MARTQPRSAKRIARYGASSDAVVVYIANHEHFSSYAGEHLIKPALRRARGSQEMPAIISVCAYTPSFFYRRIVKKSAGSGRKLLSDFEKISPGELVADNAKGLFADVREVFLQASHLAFPHFRIVEQGAQKAVRLCVFSRDDEPEVVDLLQSAAIRGNKYYVAKYGHTIPAAHTYSFFKWLNNKVPCCVLPPTQWLDWGLGQGRDFALFNSRDVVEYHDEWKSAIIVENVDDNWNQFAQIGSLVSRWKVSSNATWKSWDFFAYSYRLVMPTTIPNLIRKAACLELDGEDPDRANTRNEVLASLAKIQPSLPKLTLADVATIMNTNQEVNELLRGRLDIRNVTGFRKAVAHLIEEVPKIAARRAQK